MSNSKPKREPLPRTWFLARGFKPAPIEETNNRLIYVHPRTNDVLSPYGTKLFLCIDPKEKFRRKTTRYLRLSRDHGSKYLAYIKYITFIRPLPKGMVIDHIDGDTFNNNINNLRAVTPAINARDGGSLRKLRNNGIIISGMSKDILLPFFKRMARYKKTHTEWQYRKLTREDLLKKLFKGTGYKVTYTPSEHEKFIDRFEQMVSDYGFCAK